MSLAADLLAASQFDPAEFYKPTKPKVEKKTLCSRCGISPRIHGVSYCGQCNSLRVKEYKQRKRNGGPIRKYEKKGGK